MANSTKYQKYTQLEHILARPDTYVGSLEKEIEKQWVVEGEKMVEKQLVHVPGLYKIFDEVLVNAIDQCSVDKSVDAIKVWVNEEEIIIMNTGKGIPVEIHETEKMYIPEMIFGNLLTSSNYDDTEKRTTGGRNGYGAKLANIFSKEFSIETLDVEHNKLYKQTWKNNMSEKTEPKITTKKATKGYAKFSFKPDLTKFKMKKLDYDIVSMFEKRVYDACACTPTSVAVFYNDKKLDIKNFEKYVDMYIGDKKETMRVYEGGKRWEIVLAHNDGYKQVSFVNGISTSVGGTHVDHVVRQVIQKILDKLTLKSPNHNVKANFIKDHMFIFVKATLENPSFSSQTKTECTLKTTSFGSRFEASEDFMKKVSKLGILDDALALAKHKEMRDLSKTDGKKKTTIKNIPKLDDANKAGTSKSEKCTLILTEGDSAKAFAIAGLSIVGRDYYGVFPLRGKLLNVREATAKQLLDNAEINALKQILGLQQNKVYSSLSDLRYGNIMILTDADVDGSHIKGLIMNFIHTFWPSLLQFDFISAMITPILKATKGSVSHNFYTIPEYNEWAETQAALTGWNIKYYKGLGTSTATEAKSYFRDLEKNVINYESKLKKTTDNHMELAFKKENADKRKEWILDGIRKHHTLDFSTKNVSYDEMINKDLIWFSIADVTRSIPSVVDGLKPSQRKVIYACRKRTNKEVKVSQLAGYVSTETSYHHGEQSMMSTILQLAWDFVGSNNQNLLMPNGQFGTRLMGGKDAASSRYIFTKLSNEAINAFHNDDDSLLEYLEDDGNMIEPKYFVPKYPLILVNGAEGIGTGYSTSVPCYNPEDIIDNMKRILKGKQLKEMIPWYRGFTGKIEKDAKHNKYITKGRINLYKGYMEVLELPVGRWTQDFKEMLEGFLDTKVDTYENHCTENKVNFKIFFTRDYSRKLTEETIFKEFKLTTSLNTSNMHLFNSNGEITKYNSVEEIMNEFSQVRLEFYLKRKNFLLQKYSESLSVLSNKIRFVKEISDETIIIFKKKKQDIIELLHKRKYDKFDNGYDYLLNMKIYTLTYEIIDDMNKKKAKIEEAIHELKDKTPSTMWLEEL